MRYFDLHCDTLVACLDQNKSLIDNDLHVSVKKGDRFAPYVQCAAVWLPDSVRGAAALQYFDRHAAYFRKMAETGAFTVLETGEEKLELSRNEYKILEILMKKKGNVVPREDLIQALWDTEEFIDENTLTVNVARLRQRLKQIGVEELISTRKGVGYLIMEP